MKRGKKKAMMFKGEIGKSFEKLPTHERRAEHFARLVGRHSPYYFRKILRRGNPFAAENAMKVA